LTLLLLGLVVPDAFWPTGYLLTLNTASYYLRLAEKMIGFGLRFPLAICLRLTINEPIGVLKQRLIRA
jgi:hypothetical protein